MGVWNESNKKKSNSLNAIDCKWLSTKETCNRFRESRYSRSPNEALMKGGNGEKESKLKSRRKRGTGINNFFEHRVPVSAMISPSGS